MWKRRWLFPVLVIAGLIAIGAGVVLVNGLVSPDMICDWTVRHGSCP